MIANKKVTNYLWFWLIYSEPRRAKEAPKTPKSKEDMFLNSDMNWDFDEMTLSKASLALKCSALMIGDDAKQIENLLSVLNRDKKSWGS